MFSVNNEKKTTLIFDMWMFVLHSLITHLKKNVQTRIQNFVFQRTQRNFI